MTKSIEIEKVIEMVKSYPVLYDLSHSDYKNIYLKNKIWDEIGGKLNISGNDVKSKWKNIRDSYSRYLKSLKTTTGQSASRNTRYNKWQWASSMEFLKDHMVFASTESNFTRGNEDAAEIGNQNTIDHESSNDDQNFDSEASSAPSTSNRSTSHSRFRRCTRDNEHPVEKVISYLNAKADRLSSTEHVMLGYAKTIEGFSERRKIITKMKIAQVMMEAELAEEEGRTQQNRTLLQSYESNPPTELNRSQNDRSCTSQLSNYSHTSTDSRSQSQFSEDPLFSPPETDLSLISMTETHHETIDFENEIDELQI